MKNILIITFLFSLILLQRCTSNECDKVCFTPPNSFQFAFVDASSGENLFTKGTFDKNDIKVKNIADNSNIAFTFIDENDYNILRIESIGWQTETIEYSIKIANKERLILYVDAKRINEDCCSFTRYDEIKIEEASFTSDTQKEIYTIFIE